MPLKRVHDDERETGMVCPCMGTEDHPQKVSPDCAICHGRGWLTVTEWGAAKIAGLLPKP